MGVSVDQHTLQIVPGKHLKREYGMKMVSTHFATCFPIEGKEAELHNFG